MNTQEAISILNNNKHETLWRAKVPKIQNKNMDEIIILLQRGSAFEKMFREVENMYGSSLTWDIEQKYFPKDKVVK